MWANYNRGGCYPGDAQANGIAFINTSVLLLYVGLKCCNGVPVTHNQLLTLAREHLPAQNTAASPERWQEV